MYQNLIDELLATERAEAEQTLIFNKISGALVSRIVGSNLDKVRTEYCKGKVVTFNPATHRWVGDYDTGSLKPIIESPKEIYEKSLDGTAQRKIRDKYDYYHQLNIVIDMLSLLLEASSLTTEQKASFNKMKEYIDETRDLNNRYKDSYKNDPNWTYKTKEDAQDEVNDKLAGGLHEVIGPRLRGQGSSLDLG